MSLVTDEIIAQSEVYHGDELCQEKSQQLLKEIALPNGLLPLKDMEEVGYHRESGFVWLKQKNSTTHEFEKIGKLVSYAPEVSGYVEVGKITKLTGVKSKEFLIWITVGDISLDDPPTTGNITFKTPGGLSKTFPASAFEIETEEDAEEDNCEVKEAAAAAVEVKEL